MFRNIAHLPLFVKCRHSRLIFRFSTILTPVNGHFGRVVLVHAAPALTNAANMPDRRAYTQHASFGLDLQRPLILRLVCFQAVVACNYVLVRFATATADPAAVFQKA